MLNKTTTPSICYRRIAAGYFRGLLFKSVQEAAAMQIQTSYRAYAAKKRYVERLELKERESQKRERQASKIQIWYRHIKATQSQLKAAKLISAWALDHLQRRHAALALQSWYRQLKKETAALNAHAATMIISTLRGYLERKGYRLILKHVESMQVLYRSCRQRERYVLIREATTVLSRNIKDFLWQKHREKASTRIAAFARGVLLRQNLHLQHSAATRIQAQVRTVFLRRRYRLFQKRLIKVQAFARRVLAKKDFARRTLVKKDFIARLHWLKSLRRKYFRHWRAFISDQKLRQEYKDYLMNFESTGWRYVPRGNRLCPTARPKRPSTPTLRKRRPKSATRRTDFARNLQAMRPYLLRTLGELVHEVLKRPDFHPSQLIAPLSKLGEYGLMPMQLDLRRSVVAFVDEYAYILGQRDELINILGLLDKLCFRLENQAQGKRLSRDLAQYDYFSDLDRKDMLEIQARNFVQLLEDNLGVLLIAINAFGSVKGPKSFEEFKAEKLAT